MSQSKTFTLTSTGNDHILRPSLVAAQEKKYKKPFFVLAVDGGGIRGIIPLVVLRYIEKQVGRPAHDIFDVFVGTSTGALISTLLTLPMPHTAENALNIYKVFGKKVFKSYWLRRKLLHWIRGTRYSDDKLLALLEALCGKTKLGDLKKIVAFPAYDICNMERRIYETLHFDHRNLNVLDVLRSCVAAPTYFSPYSVIELEAEKHNRRHHHHTTQALCISAVRKRQQVSLVDGGVFANNAAIFAYNFVKSNRLAPADSNLYLLSLGTGSKYWRDTKNEHNIEPSLDSHKRQIPGCSLDWCKHFPDLMMTSESQEVDTELRTILGFRYVRVQGKVTNHKLDDCSRGNIIALEEDGLRIVENNKEQLDTFCKLVKSRLSQC